MHKFLIPMMTLTMSFAQAHSSKTQSEQKFKCTTAEQCLQASQDQKRLRLPDMLKEGIFKCQSQNNHDKAKQENCEKNLIAYANDSLNCPTDLRRYQESKKFDNKTLDATVQEYGQTEIPLEVKAVFYNLTQNANKHFKFLQKPQWQLRAYGANFTNAHAGTGGNIVISSAFWTTQKYTLGEIAAVLAHEISHVITDDSLVLGCLAHEWVSPDFFLNIEEITTIFREDFSLELPRGQQWSQLSKSLELRTDRGSKELLRLSGWDPSLMAQALTTLLPPTGEGTRGSHPTSALRLKNLED